MKITSEIYWNTAQPFVNHPVISDFQNILYSQSQTSICVSLSIAQHSIMKNFKSNQIKFYLSHTHGQQMLMRVQRNACASSSDNADIFTHEIPSQIANVPFFQKYYFFRRSVCSSRLAEKSTEKCGHYNAKLFSKLAP